MNKTNDFKFNLPAYSDPVDVADLNDNFIGIDDALMAGLCKKEYTGNNMGSSDPSARKYAWAPWFEIVNDNEFDVVVTDRNAPVESEEATINIVAGQTFRKYINGRYYMNFYVQDQHDVTFKWFTNAETYINESGGGGGGGTGTVTSVSVQGGSGSHLTASGNPIETSGTITIDIDDGYSIPSDNEQTAWDGKAADLKAEIDSSTYVLTLQLKDSSGNLIGNERTIDLPLETMVVDGEYDPQTKKIKLELKNGNYVEFSVADLVSGLQTELSASNKLDPDYIDYDASHRAVSDTEKDTWNGKQNALTFDDTPTQNSNNPVKSDGVYSELAGKQASLDQTQLAAVNSGIDQTKVAQISTNQTNILYTLGKTGKNLFEFTAEGLKQRWDSGTWNGNTFNSNFGVTIVVNDNKSIVVTGTPNAQTSLTLGIYDHTKYKGCVYSGGTSNVSTTTCISGVNNIGYDYGDGVTMTGDTDRAIQIAFFTGTNLNITFKPMICTAEDWAVGHDFAPYALPNSDLTYLEAEDRAALAEEIDAGAKNCYVPDSLTTSVGGLTITRESDGTTVKINGTYTGTDYAYINVGHFVMPKAGTYFISAVCTKPMTGSTYYAYTNDNLLTLSGAGQPYSHNYTSIPTTIPTVYIRVTPQQSFNNDTVKLLICTKAAFGVSQKFVPYKPETVKGWIKLKEQTANSDTFTLDLANMNEVMVMLVYTSGSRVYSNTFPQYILEAGYKAVVSMVDSNNPTNDVCTLQKSGSTYSGTIPSNSFKMIIYGR